MKGYAGKILRIDLTKQRVGAIPTERYDHWVGGHGMGSAIFYDIVVRGKKVDLEKIDGFDPANVITIMASPVSGTLVPAAAGRTEVQGIGVQSSPIGWFTRSNFGGRFSSQLKYAQWDGIIIEGAARSPVWIDIRDDQVTIRNCDALSLWGTDTWECQQIIFDYVGGQARYKDWFQPKGSKGDTTQRPAVLAIGPAGEHLCRTACLMHDAGNGSGQGGFGAVWGSKNLKAISVIGTGAITVNDPNALIQARIYQKKNYQFNLEDLKLDSGAGLGHQMAPKPIAFWKMPEGHRPQACVGCHAGCRARYSDGIGNESECVETTLYGDAKSADIPRKVSDLINKYGINAYEAQKFDYLRALNKKGVLGPGKQIDTGDLDFKDYGTLEFYDRFLRKMAYREGDFGNAIAEGLYRAAEKWGRLEEDLKTGLLPYPYWGLPEHGYDPRAELEWGYGSIMGDRDINEHDFNDLYWDPTLASLQGKAPQIPAEEAAKIISEKMVPYEGDMLMLDYSSDNMYSEHIAKLVSWHRHYTRFWKQSALFCDWRWADFVNLNRPDNKGSTGEAEPKFLNAVIGEEFTFLRGMYRGKKIWNLDHAIWTLQGRHRDMVDFAEYIYKVPFGGMSGPTYLLPGREDGKWKYIETVGRTLDKEKFEAWKTKFYLLEGWDPETGYPMRSTLEGLGLSYVADELEMKGKLGKEKEEKPA